MSALVPGARDSTVVLSGSGMAWDRSAAAVLLYQPCRPNKPHMTEARASCTSHVGCDLVQQHRICRAAWWADKVNANDTCTLITPEPACKACIASSCQLNIAKPLPPAPALTAHGSCSRTDEGGQPLSDHMNACGSPPWQCAKLITRAHLGVLLTNAFGACLHQAVGNAIRGRAAGPLVCRSTHQTPSAVLLAPNLCAECRHGFASSSGSAPSCQVTFANSQVSIVALPLSSPCLLVPVVPHRVVWLH